MIDGYPNFEWSPGNIITDDDTSEYEHSMGVQEETSMEYEVEIPATLEDKYLIQ